MTATQADPSLQALMLPFADGTLAWPRDGALFLRARDGWPLHERPLPGLVCEPGFQPDAQALERSGFDVREPAGSKYPLVMVLPTRQRAENGRASGREGVCKYGWIEVVGVCIKK